MRFGSKTADSISCLAWNAGKTCFALSPNDRRLHIYASEEPWRLVHTFNQHDMLVSGVDWCHRHDRIVTCSHDRNAYVLALKDGAWTPDMVVTRLKRPALCVQWSPCGQKFAIGSAGKEVSVCYSNAQDGWWAAAVIRRAGSAVMGVAWHPSGELLATASTDGKCRVFYAQPAGQADSSKAPQEVSFGQVLMEVDMSAWCLCVTWSPSGAQLACSTQGSELGVWEELTYTGSGISFASCQRLRTGLLPFKCLAFCSEDRLLAAGFDSEPFEFEKAESDGQWLLSGACKGGKSQEGQPQKELAAEFSDKLAIFKSSILTNKPVASKASAHTKTVTSMAILNSTTIVTAALDGYLLKWRI